MALVLLVVVRILPFAAVVPPILYALIFDRKALGVDYPLLATFLFFFGFADNIKALVSPMIEHSGHVFLFSALTSQAMSNVPATLLFGKFTADWKALLWGVNVGGFGSLFGSLANLIAYRVYVSRDGATDTKSFTAKFLLAGYAAFSLSVAIYFWLFL